MADDERAELRRARVRRAIPAAVLVVAGAAVLIAGGGSVGANAVGALLLGIAGVWAVSLVFYEIGLGEDRDRAAGPGSYPGKDE